MVERFTVKGWNDEQIALADEDGKWVLYEEHEDAVAALKAENEEQRERLIQFANAFDAGYAAAERALAERAGGVKVKALEWVKDNSVGGHGGWIGRAGDFSRAVKIGWMVEMPYEFGDQAFATLDDAKAAAQADYERRILSALTTEPAAPMALPSNCASDQNDGDHTAAPYSDLAPNYNDASEVKAAPEGWQEAMVEAAAPKARRLAEMAMDFLHHDADQETYDRHVEALTRKFARLTRGPADPAAARPAEQAVTEAMTWSVSGGHLSFKLPTGTDMIVVFEDKMQHIPVWIGMRHQLSVEMVEHLLTGASSITVAPYRNASKVRIDRAALKAAMEAGRHE